jgi:hypothetical protein
MQRKKSDFASINFNSHIINVAHGVVRPPPGHTRGGRAPNGVAGHTCNFRAFFFFLN